MRATLTDAIDGVWALRIIRGVVLPITMALMGWVAVELVNMRDGTRDVQSAVRELRAQIKDIRDDVKAAAKDEEMFRRQQAKIDGEKLSRLDALERSVKALGDQVLMIFRKSEAEGFGWPATRDHL